jgi:hypothetical protein
MDRYDSTLTTTRWDGKQVYLTTSYPVIVPQDSDVIVITQDGMYLDYLAYEYYQDPTLWWVIALANNLGKGRLSVPPGIQLRIPINVNDILSQMNNLNS